MKSSRFEGTPDKNFDLSASPESELPKDAIQQPEALPIKQLAEKIASVDPKPPARLEELRFELGMLSEREKRSVLLNEELIYKRTSELEARLESKRRELSSGHRGRFSANKFKKFISSLLAGVALFAGSAKSESVRSESTTEHQTNSIERTEKAIKLEISRFADTVGFDCSLSLGNGDGKYILHIGQIHKTPYNLTNAVQHARVIDYQKSIADFISSLVNDRSSTTNVFTEGFTAEDEGVCNEIRLSIKSDLDNLAFDLNSYRMLTALHSKHSSGMTDLKIFMTQLNYLFRAKLNELEKYFQSHPEATGNFNEQEKQDFERSLKYAREMFVGSNAYPGEDAIFYYGAAEKLFLDGKIYRKAAEARASNAAAFKIDDTIDDAIKKMGSASTKEESDNLAMEVGKLKASEKKITYDIREDVALRILGDFARTNNQQVIPLVYGASHDFSDNVLKWNKSHPKQPFGLIKVWRSKELDKKK